MARWQHSMTDPTGQGADDYAGMQVSEAAHQFFLLLITFDCSIAAHPN
jgi:hypothetical protein